MGDSNLIRTSSGVTAMTIGDNIYVAGENVLISLYAYDRFSVLRPSMIATV